MFPTIFSARYLICYAKLPRAKLLRLHSGIFGRLQSTVRPSKASHFNANVACFVSRGKTLGSKILSRRLHNSDARQALVIYRDRNAWTKELRTVRVIFAIQFICFITAAEVVHTMRTADAIEQAVNPDIQLNARSGVFGFLALPIILGLATAITAACYISYGRFVKKILYVPSNGTLTFVNHHLFGGKMVRTSQIGHVKTRQNLAQLDGYSWVFFVSDRGEIPNKHMFNMVMGVSDQVAR